MKTRIIWLAALALLAALVISGTAFAEGEVPLPSGAEELPATIGDPAAVEEALPPDPVIPAEPAPETPADELPVVEEPAEAELVVEPVEEALPAAEEVPVLVETPVLVDAEGEPLVLATEEAAELLIAPDPYFYIGGVPYQFTTLDCNPGIAGNQPCVNPLLAAISYIDTNALVPDGGYLYVEKATYTGNIVIDCTAKPNLSSLTGLFGFQSGGIYPTISGSLSLLNLTNGFSLVGFNITGGTLVQNSVGEFDVEYVTTTLTMNNVDASGSGMDGIYIRDHKGNIVMHHVTSNNTATGSGVYIDNQLSGTVTIDQNSEFKNNNAFGVRIITVGNVTLSNVVANDNPNESGIQINSTGIVTLNSVMANGNSYYGIDIDHSPTGSVINMNGVVANENNAGIYLRSKGATIKNVVTSNNLYAGLTVDIVSGTTLLENVVASNNGDFVEPFDGTNDEFGILIRANPGALSAVTLRNINASHNEDGGIVTNILGPINIYNTSTDNTPNGDGVSIKTNGAVTISGLGSFDNAGNGLFVRTKGAITISGIYAGNNGFSGADLDNGLCTYDAITLRWTCLGSGAIQVKNASDQMSDLSNNQHFGLWAVSKGAITVTNLRAYGNDSDGAYLTNRFGGSTAGITVNTLGAVRNDFSSNGWYEVFQPEPGDYYKVLFNGLSALSAGNISVTNTDAWKNQSGGAGIYLDTKLSTAPRTVSLTNSNAGENDWAGVWIYSYGNITLTNVSANDNQGGDGIHVDNCWDFDPFTELEDDVCAGTGTVLLTNIETHNNSGIGLTGISKGIFTLNGVNSSNNDDMGISLVNNFIGATAGVSLTNVSANDNNNTGLSVTTNGSATLGSINTHNNAKRSGGIGYTEMVQDFFNIRFGPDEWWFEANAGTAYEFRLDANALDLNRIDFNPWIELYDPSNNDSLVAVGACTENLFCTLNFTQNIYGETRSFYVKVGSTNGDGFDGNDGFYRLSLDDGNQSNPPDQIYWVSGTGITAGGSITVRGIDTSNNSLMGLGATVMGNGSITLSNLQVRNNGSEGVYLTCGQLPDWSDSGFGTGSISISGSNAISDNGWDGLIMATSGNITLSSLEANWNGQPTGSPGISIRHLENEYHAAKAVTLSGITAGDNGQWGLWFSATGNISLTNVNAWQNQNEGGIFLDNCGDILDGTIDGECISTGTVRLTTVNADNNQGKGIEIYSKGLITLSGVQANGNWQTGIRAENDFYMATAGITLGNVRAEGNNDNGILAETNGALLMSNITANSNALTWSGIDNGSSVQNYLNNDKGPDHFWFEATEGVPITLILWADGWNGFEWLNRFDFDPFLKIFDAGNNPITTNQAITFEYSETSDPDWSFTDFYQIVWTPGTDESGQYYVEVSSDNGNDGFYCMSVDDSGLTNFKSIWVDGLTYRAGGNVTMSGSNSFKNNEQAGLIGWSSSNVTIANIVGLDNGCEGIYIDNTNGSGNITLSGSNVSDMNGWEGLRVKTNGIVSISNLEANRNNLDGIRLTANTTGKAVTLTNITAMWNGISGIEMQTDGGTRGLTTLNNVNAWFNSQDGINVDTNGYSLTLLNSSFMCNDDDGFVYWGYPPLFVFTNTNNIFIGNGGDNLLVK